MNSFLTLATLATLTVAPQNGIHWTQCGRLECATIQVPLDYARPYGKKITIAVTRLKATRPRQRLGAIALNPGGPGGSGYLYPLDYAKVNPALNERYDLIGFDPRGVGHSTKVDCPELPGTRLRPVTEEAARKIYDHQVKENRTCSAYKPEFLKQLTTTNIAADLDRIRAALGERRMNFLGVSWGSWLGVVYRTNFPATVGRMWLDSIAIPRFSIAAFAEGRAKATAANFRRFAAWVAERPYGLGATGEEVVSTLEQLQEELDRAPRTYSGLRVTVDGSIVAMLASQVSPDWKLAAQGLKELHEGADPAALRKIYGGAPDTGGGEGMYNATMGHATLCNEDVRPLGFTAEWSAWQRRITKYPVTGSFGKFGAACAGWDLPREAVTVRDTGTPLMLSGHRYEVDAPYTWARQMRALVGGTLMTVNDDVHGSVLLDKQYSAKITAFFGNLQS
ncbi:alpha/beta fold hydrolase [Nonomuraea sp. NPDC050556]|uniref:alpha/beta fold hydrolase n=1 Tax=Nonomuraea sp. NPDC050556 TaxID=3364369 RepID=UPI0037A17D22